MKALKKIFFNKKILIYGLGKSGISSYFFLKKNNEIYLYDDNNNILKKKNYKKFFIKKKKIFKKNFDYIVISPGINIKNCELKNFLKKNLHKMVTDLDIFYSHYSNNKIISITGTNGKSTTAKLLSLIIQNHRQDSRLCGNIGNPILLEKNITPKTIFVIEVSSYQIDYSKIFRANHAVILNISPDHLERHGSINNYVNSKFKLIKNQSKNDFSYLNINNKYLKKKIKQRNISSKIIKIKFKNYNHLQKRISNPYFFSKGSKENLSFVFEISKKLNLQNKKVIKTINNFKGLRFRQEIIYKKNKSICINDSKATSFASSINILESMQNVFWIVGGIPKLGDKFSLSKKKCKNFSAYIYGKNKKFFIKQFHNKLTFYCFKDLKAALKRALNDFKKYNNINKTLLFSPAAASFDSFKNFEDRGDYFNFLLKKYKVKKIIDDLN